MKVFLAGATGVIGRSLIPLLLEAGHEVSAATRSERGLAMLAAAGAKGVRLDALDAKALRAALVAARPEAVMHQLTDLSSYDTEANAKLRIAGTRNLVEAAKSAGVEIMVAQSIAFAYAPGAGPASEEEPLDAAAPPPRHRSVEGVLSLENAVAEMRRGIVLRYGTLYGEGTWYGPGGLMAGKVLAGALPATPGVTSFLHVADAARAALAALGWPAGAVNIVDDEPAPGTLWLPYLAEVLGAPPPPSGKAQPWERGARNSKAASLGWRPRHGSWREGFREVFRDVLPRV